MVLLGIADEFFTTCFFLLVCRCLHLQAANMLMLTVLCFVLNTFFIMSGFWMITYSKEGYLRNFIQLVFTVELLSKFFLTLIVLPFIRYAHYENFSIWSIFSSCIDFMLWLVEKWSFCLRLYFEKWNEPSLTFIYIQVKRVCADKRLLNMNLSTLFCIMLLKITIFEFRFWLRAAISSESLTLAIPGYCSHLCIRY